MMDDYVTDAVAAALYEQWATGFKISPLWVGAAASAKTEFRIIANTAIAAYEAAVATEKEKS